MQSFAQGREIDAVVISIGVNDLGFGPLVGLCIEKPNCPAQPGTPFTILTLDELTQQRLTALSNRYERLLQALDGAGVDPTRVFITEYFDSTRGDDETTCDPLIELVGGAELATGEGLFDRAEAEWAANNVLGHLNKAVRAAADRHGWRAIRAPAQYRKHGYCSTKPWIVGLLESVERQKNKEGTLHSTAHGNFVQGRSVALIVQQSFYKKGRTRSPIRPASG